VASCARTQPVLCWHLGRSVKAVIASCDLYMHRCRYALANCRKSAHSSLVSAALGSIGAEDDCSRRTRGDWHDTVHELLPPVCQFCDCRAASDPDRTFCCCRCGFFLCGGKSSSMLVVSLEPPLPVRSLPLPSGRLIEPTPVLEAVAAALRVTRRVADAGAGISLLGATACVTGVDKLPSKGSVFSPSKDRTTPNPSDPMPPPRAPQPPASPPPALVLPLRGGAGPLAASGGGPIAPGVCMPDSMSGVCSPPCIIILAPIDADDGVANDSAPPPLPPWPPVNGVACIELLFGPVHGVTGTLLAPNMLEFTEGVADDKGVPGMPPFAPGVAVTPPVSIEMFARLPDCALLQGATAVKCAAMLLFTTNPTACCA